MTRRSNRRGRTPRRLLVPKANRSVFPIYERNTYIQASSGTGTIAQTLGVALNSILAARLSGLQALHDQARIDQVRISLMPMNGSDTEGILAVYIERDPTAAAVATPALAADQFEVSVAPAWRAQVLNWYPQQPTDRAFLALNPGTTLLANFFLVGSGFPTSVNCYEVTLEMWLSVRGRP